MQTDNLAPAKTTIANLLASATQQLKQAGCGSPQLDAELLLGHTLNKNRAWLYANGNQPLQKHHQNIFGALLARRTNREPVAYLTQHKPFFGLDFLVTPQVLIPRPETELLVETAITLIKANLIKSRNNKRLLIVDVGTGSGCIAVALAKNLPQAQLLAVDVSPKAIKVAQCNVARHRVQPQVDCMVGNLLQSIAGSINLIVSNPPYINPLNLPATMPEVSRYEPQLALDGGPSGLQIIDRLLKQAAQKVAAGGALLVEIGAEQGHLAKQLAQTYFANARVQIKQDIAGLDRLLVVQPD